MEIVMLWLACAVACALISRAKGRSVGGWFVLGLLFALIALMIVLLLPSTKPRCPHRAERIQPEAKICPHCQRKVVQHAEPASQPPWGPRPTDKHGPSLERYLSDRQADE